MGSKGCKLDYEGAICNCSYGCKYRDERITTLKAEVERLKKANQHWHDRQPERDAQLELHARVEELEGELAEAIKEATPMIEGIRSQESRQWLEKHK